MNVGFDTRKFHEREDFFVALATPLERKVITSYFETHSFIIEQDADFAYLERDVSDAPWQSSDITQVDFLLCARPSNPPDTIDALNFVYLLATLPENTVHTFASIVRDFAIKFAGEIRHRDEIVDGRQIEDILNTYVRELKMELGDAPGTDFVARMVYEFSPRR